MTITILYGSQTGNAEDMAKRIGYQAQTCGFNVTVQSMDDFALTQLPKQNIVIFVCSTTGHGQEPENMKKFYNFIRRRDLPKDCLKSLQFAVYGLGSSSYVKFNYVSKILFKRLISCGANPLQPLVLGDEQHPLGCDGIFYPKLEELWSSLGTKERNILDEQLPRSSYRMQLNDRNEEHDLKRTQVFRDSYITNYGISSASCTTNLRLTPNQHFQDTRLLIFKPDSPIHFEPGDVCTILPQNSEENINEFLSILNLDPDQSFCIQKKSPNYMINYLYDFIPDNLRIVDLVRHYLDIQSIPKRTFFEFLWPFSDNDLERDKLKEFSTTEGQEELYTYCTLPKRSILEVLQDFPHTVKNIQFEYILDLIPPIKPRSFSIASSLKVHPNEFHLIVGVVEYRTRLRKKRIGLCSSFLSKLKPVDGTGDTTSASSIQFFIKQSSFKLPSDPSVPVIMIAAGLGIAPFRSFIEERSTGDKDNQVNCLYFGCRYKNADFYFREELEEYSKVGLLQLRFACSREDRKEYVQDILTGSEVDIIRDLIEKKAIIYVAGNSKLPEELRKKLSEILPPLNLSQEKLTDKMENISKLETIGRIQYDCW